MQHLVLSALLLLQAAEPTTEVRSAVASIVDDSGAAIPDLAREDVALLEDGVARKLLSVAPDRRPLHLAILVDSSQPVASDYRLHVVPALTRFLGQLPRGTLYTLWVTGDRPTKLVDQTDERARASVALQRVFPQGGNMLLDALMEASKDLEVPEEGRGAIVVVTGDGVGFTNYDRRLVVERVGEGNSAVYGVQYDGAVATSTGGDPTTTRSFDYDYVLDNLSKATGGRREHVLTAMAVERALSGVLAELTGRYRITYETVSGPDRRDLSLEIAHPGAHVRTVQPER